LSLNLETSIAYIKGVGPQRAQLLKDELGIETFNDLINHFPFRYEDRSSMLQIADIDPDKGNVQLKAKIVNVLTAGSKRSTRLVAIAEDSTGQIELVWFRGIKWISKKLVIGRTYIIFGKPGIFSKSISIPHPEIEPFHPQKANENELIPVYPSTDKLRSKYLDSKGLRKVVKELFSSQKIFIPDFLPSEIVKSFHLYERNEAYHTVHFPQSMNEVSKARFRLKYEELFLIQIRLLKENHERKEKFPGFIFDKTDLLTKFYNDIIPFELTNAQKRVVREIYTDLKSGKQMNRLLQGDVGSGKTMVAFLSILLALESGTQAAFMAPTEILAIQHYNNISVYCAKLGVKCALLTGSTKSAIRKSLFEQLQTGELDVLVGTHAILEEKVIMKCLGIAVIDEQHRFGVAQRARLWQKNHTTKPHILVMTATPIPRTLAMTLYGDLDVSIIDELPKGRKEIKTYHYKEKSRLKIFGFLKKQIQEGSQCYIVYPLIEESSKLDYKDLMDGYESICRAFPNVPISILHGRMKSQDKDFEMERFKQGETKILVSTTVIEVGVDVPNASVIVIENAEKFGLAQLHQLRGRVGRGNQQSYCILMSGNKLSKEAKVRLETMVRTNNGFEIADVDLSLRGPGELSGTRQSGTLDLKIANLAQDGKILQAARQAAKSILSEDPELELPEHKGLRLHLKSLAKEIVPWQRIS
jgi:ATP-dependent DNA helicase RecG